MARKKNMDYELIYELYGLEKRAKSKSEDKKFHRILNYHFDKYKKKIGRPDAIWDSLTKEEQAEFICNEIQQPLFKQIDEITQEHVIENLQEKYPELYPEANERIKEHNKEVERLFKKYFAKNDTVNKKQKAYEQFCKDMSIYAPKMRLPSYEEFVKHPLSPYDYVQSYREEVCSQPPTEKTVSRLDRIELLLEIALDILEKECSIKIDYDKIDECLEYFADSDRYSLEALGSYGEFDSIFTEYPPALFDKEIVERIKEFGVTIPEDELYLQISKEEHLKHLKTKADYSKYTKMRSDIKGFWKKVSRYR